MRLALSERQKVEMVRDAMLRAVAGTEEQEERLWDLNDLRADIVTSLGMYWWLFLLYASLLAKEPYLYDPMEAYQFGCRCALAGEERRQGLLRYHSAVERRPQVSAHHRQVQRLHDQLLALLRPMGQHPLLWEYAQAYRQAFGILAIHIDVFFDMGYDAGREGEKAWPVRRMIWGTIRRWRRKLDNWPKN